MKRKSNDTSTSSSGSDGDENDHPRHDQASYPRHTPDFADRKHRCCCCTCSRQRRKRVKEAPSNENLTIVRINTSISDKNTKPPAYHTTAQKSEAKDKHGSHTTAHRGSLVQKANLNIKRGVSKSVTSQSKKTNNSVSVKSLNQDNIKKGGKKLPRLEEDIKKEPDKKEVEKGLKAVFNIFHSKVPPNLTDGKKLAETQKDSMERINVKKKKNSSNKKDSKDSEKGQGSDAHKKTSTDSPTDPADLSKRKRSREAKPGVNNFKIVDSDEEEESSNGFLAFLSFLAKPFRAVHHFTTKKLFHHQDDEDDNLEDDANKDDDELEEGETRRKKKRKRGFFNFFKIWERKSKKHKDNKQGFPKKKNKWYFIKRKKLHTDESKKTKARNWSRRI